MSKPLYNKLCIVCGSDELFQEREVEIIKTFGMVEHYEIPHYKIKCRSCENEWDDFEIIFDEEDNVIGVILND